MSFRAMDHSVTVVAYEKGGKKYAMTCAWAMMVDYDKILCLLGAQSTTAKNIKKNDFIGVSTLNKNQKELAIRLGENHSEEVYKLSGIEKSQDDTAITINQACRTMICRVLDVYHLPKIEEDSLVYLEIVEKEENGDNFLHMSDI